MSQSEDFAYNAHGLDYTTELDGRIKHLVIRVRRFDQTPADPVMLEPSDRTEPGVAWSTKELDTEKAPTNTLAAVVGEYLSSDALESARAEGTVATRAAARYMVVSPLHHRSKASLYVLIRKERGLCVAQSIAGDPTTSQRMFWYQEFVDEGGDKTTAWRTRWQAWSSALRGFKNDYRTKHIDQDCTSEHHDKEDSVLLEEELDNQGLATFELRRNGDKGDLAGLLRDLFKDPQGFDDAEALERAIKTFAGSDPYEISQTSILRFSKGLQRLEKDVPVELYWPFLDTFSAICRWGELARAPLPSLITYAFELANRELDRNLATRQASVASTNTMNGQEGARETRKRSRERMDTTWPTNQSNAATSEDESESESAGSNEDVYQPTSDDSMDESVHEDPDSSQDDSDVPLTKRQRTTPSRSGRDARRRSKGPGSRRNPRAKTNANARQTC